MQYVYVFIYIYLSLYIYIYIYANIVFTCRFTMGAFTHHYSSTGMMQLAGWWCQVYHHSLVTQRCRSWLGILESLRGLLYLIFWSRLSLTSGGLSHMSCCCYQLIPIVINFDGWSLKLRICGARDSCALLDASHSIWFQPSSASKRTRTGRDRRRDVASNS